MAPPTPPGRSPKARLPIEWLGHCWHQSLMSTCSLTADGGPPMFVSFDRRPLTTQPLPVGSAHVSLNTGANPPIGASDV
jgi:hypothetical protein